MAAAKGNGPMVALLRRVGATLAAEAKRKLAPRLVVAAGKAEADTVQLLLAAGVPVDAAAPSMVLEGHTGPMRFAMGVYTYDGESGGRPSYKQQGGQGCLFYASDSGLWFVGNEKGKAAGWIHSVERHCESPDDVTSWNVYGGSSWSVDTALQCRMVRAVRSQGVCPSWRVQGRSNPMHAVIVCGRPAVVAGKGLATMGGRWRSAQSRLCPHGHRRICSVAQCHGCG